MAMRQDQGGTDAGHCVSIHRAGDKATACALGFTAALKEWPREDGWLNHDVSTVNLHSARVILESALRGCPDA